MSNSLAIAAVTATVVSLLKNRLTEEFSNDPELVGIVPPEDGAWVTKLPPSKARDGRDTNQLNVFLYHVGMNAAWRNLDAPTQARRGESGTPPLALDLYYLLTAYGASDNEVDAHRLLGRAMRVLYDHPVILPSDIPGPSSDPPDMSASRLAEQIERVRIVPHAMPMEELSRLWQTFQTEYRVSMPYRASVVLIESRRPVRAALPVLRRGSDDRGVQVAPGLGAPTFPSLFAVDLPVGSTGAAPGETITLRGLGFSVATATVVIAHQTLHTAHPVTFPSPASDTELAVTLPSDATAVRAGPCLVSIKLERPGHAPVTTNALPLLALPKISGPPSAPAVTTSGANHLVTVTFTPPVERHQRVSLLLDDREYPAPGAADGTPRSSIAFEVPGAVHGAFLARLRVDGIDSALVNRSAEPPTFIAPTVMLPLLP